MSPTEKARRRCASHAKSVASSVVTTAVLEQLVEVVEPLAHERGDPEVERDRQRLLARHLLQAEGTRAAGGRGGRTRAPDAVTGRVRRRAAGRGRGAGTAAAAAAVNKTHRSLELVVRRPRAVGAAWTRVSMPIVPSMYVDASSSTFCTRSPARRRGGGAPARTAAATTPRRSSPPAPCAAALQNSVASPTSAICFATATCSRASASLLSRCLKSLTKVS